MNTHEQRDDSADPWAVFERSVPGWFRVRTNDDGPEMYVGAVIGKDGKPVVTSLVLNGEESLTAADLRRIPLRRIEAALGGHHLIEWVRTASTNPLSELQEVADEGPAQAVPAAQRRPRLERPTGNDTESFYSQVATAYRAYVQHSSKPAVEIATEAGVPVATARRWINHARELGLLEKGQRGRAI